MGNSAKVLKILSLRGGLPLLSGKIVREPFPSRFTSRKGARYTARLFPPKMYTLVHIASWSVERSVNIAERKNAKAEDSQGNATPL
jgi:hypothetical protein